MKPAVAKIFLLLSHERSGSHLAGEFIGAHQNFRMIDEVCNPGAVRPAKHRESFQRFQYDHIQADPNYLLEPSRASHTAFVAAFFEHLQGLRAPHDIAIDIKYGHVQNFEWWWCPVLERPYLLNFCQEREIGIVHLYRENVVAATVSSLIADKRKIWHSWQPGAQTDTQERYRLPVREIVRRAKLLQRQSRLYKDWTDANRKLEVTYEEISANLGIGGETDAKFEGFLGAKLKQPFQPRHEKLTRPMQEVVENYDELKTACIAEGLRSCVA